MNMSQTYLPHLLPKLGIMTMSSDDLSSCEKLMHSIIEEKKIILYACNKEKFTFKFFCIEEGSEKTF